MGTGIVARKEYIKNHSEEAMYNAEWFNKWIRN
jgi:hypothetical protein